jgi:hypothetical protein
MASQSSYQTNLCLSPLAEMSLFDGVSLPAEFGADNVSAALIYILRLVRYICLQHFILVRRNKQSHVWIRLFDVSRARIPLLLSSFLYCG